MLGENDVKQTVAEESVYTPGDEAKAGIEEAEFCKQAHRQRSLTYSNADRLGVLDEQPGADPETAGSIGDSYHVAVDEVIQGFRIPKAQMVNVPTPGSDDVDIGDLHSTDEHLREAGAWSANVDDLAAVPSVVQDADLIDDLRDVELTVGRNARC